jgi:subtilase family protein
MPHEPERELVVIVDPAAGFRTGLAGAPSLQTGSAAGLIALLANEGVQMKPLFGRDEEEFGAALPARASAPGLAELTSFYRIQAPEQRLQRLAARLREMRFVRAAYVKPPVELPVAMVPAPRPELPSVTPNLAGNQKYLEAAPGGIDALFAWSLAGGQGDGVEIIDIEGAWRFTHEDLTQHQAGLAGGTLINDLNTRNHGTAVIGVLGGDDNDFGIKGICPNANVRTISHSGLGVAAAITTAASLLSPGDIILVEAHAAGPRFNFSQPSGQNGFVAMQYWPDVFAAITFATIVRGVIVVEAAGNGAEDLDDPLYSIPPLGFPPLWTPFDRSQSDNGAILVGAGAPPPGTNGRDNGPDRSRLAFSNFAACVDAQGWGAEVTTCGYGDLQGGPNEDVWYTNQFNGTSSASPVVVGALACVQGALKAAGKPLLTPISARQLLRTFGSVQQDAPLRPATQRIGSRPDLFFMLSSL